MDQSGEIREAALSVNGQLSMAEGSLLAQALNGFFKTMKKVVDRNPFWGYT